MAKPGPKPKDDEAALRVMADLIVAGSFKAPVRGQSRGISKAARLVAKFLPAPAGQSERAEIERLRKSYREHREKLERDARRRRKVRLGRAYQQGGIRAWQSARAGLLPTPILGPLLYSREYSREITAKKAKPIADLMEHELGIARDILVPSLRTAENDGELRERCAALAGILEAAATTLRDIGKIPRK